MSRAAELTYALRAYAVEAEALSARLARQENLCITDIKALVIMIDAGRAGTAVTVADLATALGISRPSVSIMADRLESSGHARRRRDGSDRRRVWVEATEKTRQVGLAHFGQVFADSLSVLANYGEADIDAALTLVRELTHVLSNSRARQELKRRGPASRRDLA